MFITSHIPFLKVQLPLYLIKFYSIKEYEGVEI